MGHSTRFAACAFGLVLTALGPLAPAPVFGGDGDIDFTFGVFGEAVRGPGTAERVVVLPDGSLRLGIRQGYNVGFMALDEDGDIDTSFGDGGVKIVPLLGSETADYVMALLARPNGRLLLVASTDSGDQAALVQVTADGELDPDFGAGGISLVRHSSFDATQALAATLQSDGMVLLAGYCLDCGPTTGVDTMVTRYDTEGVRDTTFGDNGWVIFDAVEGDTTYDEASAVAIDTEGRIVLGGRVGYDAEERPYVARRHADGSVDTTFAGIDGVRTLTALVLQHVTSLVVDPVLERIVVSTGHRQHLDPDTCAVARLRDSGALDTTFSGDGIVPLNFEEGTNLHQLLLQSDGKIVAVGSIDGDLDPVEGFLLVRLLANGTLDSSYSDDGRRRFEIDLDPDGRDFAAAAVLMGGRLLAVGAAYEGGVPQIALVRTANALIFTDGFERGSTAGWPGN